jgi:hypothetical protein
MHALLEVLATALMALAIVQKRDELLELLGRSPFERKTGYSEAPHLFGEALKNRVTALERGDAAEDRVL